MSLRGAVKAVIQKLENAANGAGTSAYASMRVAGQPTPCIVFDLSIRQTIPMPNSGTFGGGGKRHYDVSVEVACIADDLDSALVLLEELQAEFPDGGPYTETVGTETIKITCTEFGEFTTRAEVPDDGQHDAKRVVSGTITLQATEN